MTKAGERLIRSAKQALAATREVPSAQNVPDKVLLNLLKKAEEDALEWSWSSYPSKTVRDICRELVRLRTELGLK